jgi:hypothetical protein
MDRQRRKVLTTNSQLFTVLGERNNTIHAALTSVDQINFSTLIYKSLCMSVFLFSSFNGIPILHSMRLSGRCQTCCCCKQSSRPLVHRRPYAQVPLYRPHLNIQILCPCILKVPMSLQGSASYASAINITVN